MSDTDRVRAWRARLKQSGLVPMTIWVSAATRARYEDLALTYRRSPSELASAALEAYRPEASVSATVAETAQLRTLIRAELVQLTDGVTATVTDTVTDTLTARLQALVAAAVATGERGGAAGAAPPPDRGPGPAVASDPAVPVPDQACTGPGSSPGDSVSVPDTATAPVPDHDPVTATEPVTPAPGCDQGSARRPVPDHDPVAASAPVTAPVTATATETPAARQPLDAAPVPAQRAPAAPAAPGAWSGTGYDPDVACARMQALQATGLSLAQIAARLSTEGLRTRHGKPWHKSTVAYVLKTHGRQA